MGVGSLTNGCQDGTSPVASFSSSSFKRCTLPGGPRGRSVTKQNRFWHLVATDLRRAELAQFIFPTGHVLPQHNASQDLLAVMLVGDANECCLQHGRMGQQGFVDLARRDVYPA